MMKIRNAPTKLLAQLFFFLVASVLLQVQISVSADDTQVTAESKTKLAPPINEKDGQVLFKLAEGWLSLGQLPEKTTNYPVSELSGIRVTIRYSGIIMGAGDAITPSPKINWTQTRTVNATDLLKKAMHEALLGAQRKIKLKTLSQNQAKGKTPSKDAKQPESQTVEAATFETLKNATLDIQFAKGLKEVWVPKGQHILQHFAYNHHGLVIGVREADNNGKWQVIRQARIWPATMLNRNVAPDVQLKLLLRDAGVPESGMRYLGAQDNESFQVARFDAMHLTRTEIGGPVSRLIRGQRTLPGTSLDSTTLRSIRERLNLHLISRIRSDGLFKGTYAPTPDQWETTIASPTSSALTIYAMHRHWQLLPDHSPVKGTLKSLLKKSAEKLLPVLLMTMTGDPDDPTNPIDQAKSPQGYETARKKYEKLLATQATGRALMLLTILESDLFIQQRQQRDQLALKLKAWLDKLEPYGLAPVSPNAVGAQKSDENAYTQATKPGEAQAETQTPERKLKSLLTPRILALYALTRHTRQTGQGQLEELKKATERIWINLNIQSLSGNIGSMNWLMRFHQYMQYLKWETPTAKDRQTVLITIGEKLREKIIKDVEPELGPKDVIGGIPRGKIMPGTIQDADWITAEVMGFLALCTQSLPNSDVNDPAAQRTKFKWLMDTALTGRFVAQLMFDEYSSYYTRLPTVVQGGLRKSFWDNRLPLDASATALLSCCELQQAIDQFKIARPK